MLCQDIEIKYKHVMGDHSNMCYQHQSFTPNSLPQLTTQRFSNIKLHVLTVPDLAQISSRYAIQVEISWSWCWRCRVSITGYDDRNVFWKTIRNKTQLRNSLSRVLSVRLTAFSTQVLLCWTVRTADSVNVTYLLATFILWNVLESVEIRVISV